MPSRPPTVLRQLADWPRYHACEWDLRVDHASRQYWDRLFRWHLDDVLIPLIRSAYPQAPETELAACRHAYLARLDELLASPPAQARLDVFSYTTVPATVLPQFGFADPFQLIKARENEAALALLPDVLAELDTLPAPALPHALARGLMAGNIFDLGAKATIQMHRDGHTAFGRTRDRLPPRPWRYDDVDAWSTRWTAAPPYRHAVFFIDNAGSDITLACLPLARALLRQGTRVTLAANSRPALNDITAAELAPLLAHAAALDGQLATACRTDQLRIRATGSANSLLDLARLQPEFVEAVADADLVMLHGMGRAVESNFHADFTCDVVRSAVLKDEAVAERVGGKLFDCVFRFSSATPDRA
jgi:type II pantothenate kinase